MGLIIAAYLMLAGVFGSAVHDKIIKDDCKLQTYRFELSAAENAGDTEKARYIQSRIDRFK